MHTCGPRGTVDGVSSHNGGYDTGFWETDIDGEKVFENFDDCGACSIVRAVETEMCLRIRSELPMCGRARVERLRW